MRRRLEISPEAYARVARVALVALTLIVFTGAAVRVTRSGLGCPDWPKCYGRTIAPLETHAVIEYVNRLLSGLVGLAAIAAGALAFLRRPLRRDLAMLGALLPLGVVCQAALGAITVREHLAPGYVMGHFGLSMLILIAAVALAWRARFEPGARPRSHDWATVWAVRGLVPLGALALFAGTAATASGPHAGGRANERIHRLDFRGQDTLDWVIQQHARIAALLGLAALSVWVIVRRRGGDRQLRRATTALAVLVGVQGGVGALQYALELPAEIVWVHVVLAAVTWLAILWAMLAAGRLRPRAAPEPAEPPALEPTEQPPARVAG